MTTTATRMFIDERDGDGIVSSNPGEVFFWLLSKRPNDLYRSAEFAQIADMAHHGKLSLSDRGVASAYHFLVV